jgi:hypothetical protein
MMVPAHAPRSPSRRAIACVEGGVMLIRNASKLCKQRGFYGRPEPTGYGSYAFVIGTAAGQYRLPVTLGMGSIMNTGRVNASVVEAILLREEPAVSAARVTEAD